MANMPLNTSEGVTQSPRDYSLPGDGAALHGSWLSIGFFGEAIARPPCP